MRMNVGGSVATRAICSTIPFKVDPSAFNSHFSSIKPPGINKTEKDVPKPPQYANKDDPKSSGKFSGFSGKPDFQKPRFDRDAPMRPDRQQNQQ